MLFIIKIINNYKLIVSKTTKKIKNYPNKEVKFL